MEKIFIVQVYYVPQWLLFLCAGHAFTTTNDILWCIVGGYLRICGWTGSLRIALNVVSSVMFCGHFGTVIVSNGSRIVYSSRLNFYSHYEPPRWNLVALFRALSI